MGDDLRSFVVEEHDDGVVVEDADFPADVFLAHLKVGSDDRDDPTFYCGFSRRFRSLDSGRFGRWRNGRNRLWCRVPGFLGCGVSMVVLVRAFGVVVEVELIYLRLQGSDCGCRRLLAQERVQGVVKAFVLALGGGFVGLPGHGLDPHGLQMLHEHPTLAPACWIEGQAIVGKESLRHAMAFNRHVHDRHGRLTGFRFCHQGGHGQPGMVIDNLEDDDLAEISQFPFGAINLPARIGLGIVESQVRIVGPLLGLRDYHARRLEDPRHGGGGGRLDSLAIKFCNSAQRPMIPPGILQRFPRKDQ